MAFGIGSAIKDAIGKAVPKELGDIASVAALIPGPHQPIAAGLAALGGYREGGFKEAAKKGIGAYLGGQFTSGLARGSGFGPQFMQRGFGSGEGSQFLNFLGDPVRGAGESVGGFFAPTEVVAGQATGVTPEGDVFFKPGELPTGGVTQTAATGVTPEGDIFFKPGEIPGAEKVSPNLLSRLSEAKGLNKLKVVYDFMSDPKNKFIVSALGGTAAAVLQYLENRAREQNKIDLTLGPEPGYMSDLRGTNPRFTRAKDGGSIGLANGGEPAMEMDYRGGGFIPVGAKERADDVPARLSKNEFVMTADAVRAAGGGSVDVGAQRMYDLMNRLEAQA
jgi:hypothetical protein